MALENQLAKLKLVVGAIVLCVMIAALLWGESRMVSPYELQKFDSSPVRTLIVSVPASAREKFLSRMKKFAEVGGFSERIKPIHPVDPQFSIDLWRDDIGIFGDNLHSDSEFSLGFYPNKLKPISEIAADGIVESVVKEISDVSGVTTSVVKH